MDNPLRPKALTPQKLTDIWKSGYCRQTVEHARTQTDDSPNGSLKRIEWLREHIKTCQDCFFATHLKAKEGTAAQQMGPRAHSAFLMGEDITKRPGYTPGLGQDALHALRQEGIATDAFYAWMRRAALRGKYKVKRRG